MKTSILCLTVVCLFSNVGYAESMFSEEAVHACFTPAEDCTGYIVNAINEAKEEILVQAYSFTSTPIANALIDASNRHVTIKIILDKSQVMQKYSVTTLLNNNRLPVWIDSKVAIAHNKVIIIDKHLLLTGSFNFTKAAQTHNAENILFINNENLAKQYADNWYQRQQASLPYIQYIQKIQEN